MAETYEKIVSIKFQSDQAIRGIQQLNAAIEQNTNDLKQMAAEGQKGSKGYAVLEQQTKALKKEKQDLSRAVQNEIKEQTSLDGSLRQLRAQLSNLTQQYDKLSKAERENVNVGGKLQKQINQVTNEIKNAEQSTQRYYRNVGNYQNAIMSALGMNNQYIQSMMLLSSSSQGVSGAFGAMGSSIKAFGASLMGLMSNPVFLALAGIAGVGMAFKWFYDYNEGIAEANRLTREFTGYTGDDLVAMRNSIQATADVMGKDFKETLQTVDALMANFHLTGAEAMDVINKGFAAGADVNGDMLQKIQQYAPTFHDAGIEADQLVAIISQTRSGIFSEQGLDAIKQGSARIREMSTTTRQALEGIGIDVNEMQRKLREGTMGTFEAVQQVSAQLQKLPDNAQEVGEVMSAVFGRQGKFASQEMIESLATMSTSLDEVKDKTGEYGDLLLENINTEEELDNVTSAIFDMTNKGWEEAKQKATIYAKQALVAVAKALLDVINWVRKLYNDSLAFRLVVQTVVATFKSLWSVIKFVFSNIKIAINGLVDMFSGLATAIQGVFSLDGKMIVQGWNKARNAVIKGASDWGAAAYKMGSEVGTNFVDGVTDAVNAQQLEMLTVSSFSGAGGGGGSPRATGGTGGGGGRSTGGRSRGSRSSGRTSTPKKTTTQKTGKTDAEKEAERLEKERQQRMAALIKKGAELEQKAREEVLRQTAEGIVQLYKERADAIFAQFEGIETKTEAEAEALTKARNAMLKANLDEQEKELQKYRDAIAKKNADEQAKAATDAKALVQTWLDSTTEGTQAHLNWQLELIRMEKEAELALYENNEQMKQAIIAKYAKQEEDARRNNAQAIQQIEQTKYEAIGTMVGGLGEIMGAFGDQSKEAAVLQKTLALGEIMIAQAVAIANAVKAGSNAVTPWQMIAQIATSIVTVTTAMAQAFAALDQAKFATGGYIQGAGTGTSDSIPVRVSNGESIMNANTTAMFGGLLSSLNQLGGGVPIQVQQTASSVRGEDMLARAVARGVAMLPAPVVSVEDINRGQRQVQVMNERATL